MVPGEAEKTERLNTSPYAFGAIPENELLRIKGHSKIKCAVKWAKKGKSAVEIASMYGISAHHADHAGGHPHQFRKGCDRKSAGHVLEAEGGYRVPVECERNRRRRFWSRRRSCASWWKKRTARCSS